MTDKKINRADIFFEISQKKITKVRAAEILGISFRHLHRLYKDFQERGLIALASKQHGKPSNNQLPNILKSRVQELITNPNYKGFGPTFMCEKLKLYHGINISIETTRKLMIANGLWESGKKRRPVIHQQRKRRARFGELNQIDGSPHPWLEDRGAPCVLINFVDDATGRTYGKFFDSETTEAYMETTFEYIKKYGRPIAFYSDKFGVFRINKPGCLKKDLITQFGRACKELDIELICANSPQAKGRVERNNRTQQDRLVKELRIRGINNKEDANRFLQNEYWDMYNAKFSVKPECNQDSHRELLSSQNLEMILCNKTLRTISKNLEISYKNTTYQITSEKPTWKLRGAKVTIIEGLKGQIYMEYQGKPLSFKKFTEQKFVGEEVNSKEIDRFLKESKAHKVSNTHPWKKEGRAEAKRREYQHL